MMIQDHVHLKLSTDSWNHATSSYHAIMPGPDPRGYAAVSPERALLGALMIHRLVETGAAAKIRDVQMTFLATADEKTRLDAMDGEVCLYIPYDHATGTSHTGVGGYTVLVQLDAGKQQTPYGAYWLMPAKVLDNSR